MQQTRAQQFQQEIQQALAASEWGSHADPGVRALYRETVLTQLLTYSAVDLVEVREHVRSLAEKQR
jgi:hypothetical protein